MTRIPLPALVLSLSAFTLPILGTSCREEQALAVEDAHDHDEVTVQVTVWGPRHELFIEYPPPVAGLPVRFVVHVTDHLDGTPRRAGEVRFALRGPSGAEQEVADPAPARTGIYLPHLTFPSAGAWTVTVVVPEATGEARIELPPVLVYADPHAAAHAEPGAELDGVAFLKEQQWRLGTRIEEVASRAVREHAVVPAVVRAAPERRARVSPPAAGVLIAAPGAPGLVLGRRVEAGELLAYLRPPLSDLALRRIEAEAELERTRLALDHATGVLARTRSLFEEEARSRRELEDAQFLHQSAEAAHRGAEAVVAGLRRSGLVLAGGEPGDGSALPMFELRAPIGGRITQVAAVLGEHLDADRAVLEILDADVVHIELRVQPGERAQLDGSQPPTLRGLRTGRGAGKALELPALRPLDIEPEVDPATQTLPLLYVAENPSGPDKLAVGMRLEALLPVGDATEGPAVPFGALVDDDGQPTVYVQLTGELFEKRPVRLGARDASWVRVLEGLAPGERVVTDGAYAVRLASASGAIPAHHH